MVPITEIITLLVIFIGILILAYVGTKKIVGLKQGGALKKNLQIVEVLPLTVGQYLYIIKIGQEYHLFSGTKETIRHCFKIDEGNLSFSNSEVAPFNEYLKKFTKMKEGDKDEEK